MTARACSGPARRRHRPQQGLPSPSLFRQWRQPDYHRRHSGRADRVLPRDAPPPTAAFDVDLPGQRKGKVVAADSAGQFRIQLRDASIIDRLCEIGWLSRDEAAAGQRLAHLFEATSLRPSLGSNLSPSIDGHDSLFALKRLNADELRSWRRLGALLSVVPAPCRASVEAACLWGVSPDTLTGLRLGLRAVAHALHR